MTDFTSEEPRISQADPTIPSKAPGKGAVLLFCGSVIFSVLLAASAVTFAIWHSEHDISANNQDWCTALSILTRTPVTYPADPKANPSRVFSYNLYESFRTIEGKFGC